MNAIALDAHPAEPELIAYARGELADASDRQIEEHLEQCETCCQTLSRLSSDTLVSMLRRPLPEMPAAPQTHATLPGVQPTAVPLMDQPTILPRADATRGPGQPLPQVAGLPTELATHSKYEILKLLGQGGMGNVYQAQHRMMNRLVALKVINQQLVQNESAVKRFHREVRAAARLSHPNIVAAYDAEQAGDVHFLVMEYVDGVELAEVVRAGGPLPVASACEFARQTALGLAHAHELGMVHRDIKPQNLMLTTSRDGAEPIVKILDFGLANFAAESADPVSPAEAGNTAAVASHLTLSGSMMGTPDYISPEQAKDAHSADIRADVYSLGCTLYFLLSGAPPFASGSVLDKVMAHVEREPRRISEMRGDLPAGLEAVLGRMMAKNPAERYQTPGDVAAALAEFASRTPVGNALRGVPHTSPKVSPRQVLIPLAIAASVCLAIFVALAAVLVVVTDKGRLEIQSNVDDVQVQIKQGGKEVAVLDLKTGSQVKWLPSGKYEVEFKGDANAFTLDRGGFELTRFGSAIVVAKWNPAGLGVIRSFGPSDKPIATDGVSPAEGGWKITADAPRTLRLFDIPEPNLAGGPYFYRAKLKSENVKGKAYLEMWSRFDGQSEFFSKGLDKPLIGTNDWAEYQIPFYPNKGESPDLVKLSFTFEGTGTVWIKDIELLGRQVVPEALAGGTSNAKAIPEGENWQPLFNGKDLTGWTPQGRGDSWRVEDGLLVGEGSAGYPGLFLATDREFGDFHLRATARLGGDANSGLLVRGNFDIAPSGYEVNLTTDPTQAIKTGGLYVMAVDSSRKPIIRGAQRPKVNDLVKADEWFTIEVLARGNRLVCRVNGKTTLDYVDSDIRARDKGRLAIQLFGPSKITKVEFKSIEVGTLPKHLGRLADTGNLRPGIAQVGPKPTKPAAPIPRPSIPLGQNLITDPSLEGTAPGKVYPEGWGVGNILPPKSYKHQVVEGGRTGKRGWQIEGDGQFAVIPTNRPPAHTAYRYAARGWVRIEAGSAQIKLLYFDANGTYLGENRSAVSFNHDGWHRLTMIDDLAKYPEARYLSLAPTFIGKGKAVFDDLELIAFDAKMLPKNFETEYGSVATNHSAVFDRWVGRWETTSEHKPTSATPERTIKGVVVVRKILDDQFLWWEWKGENDSGSYHTLLAFDEYVGGYHIWLFGERGEFFERIGQWDAASQTLTLQLKPPSPGVSGTSTDRFANNDRIESSLFVKGSDGQVTRDMRMTWLRKSAEVSGEIRRAGGPAKAPEELLLLDKMAGNWTMRSTEQPSVWSPEGKVETFTEQVEWVLGGRFLLFRTYNDKQQMSTLAFMSYDPQEKSYHFWHFAKGSYGGQWRITWDASSRAFHWRSVDMPAGWIGTGFDRWIDDDTFDSQALIKDEQGRVLLDSRHLKRRVK